MQSQAPEQNQPTIASRIFVATISGLISGLIIAHVLDKR